MRVINDITSILGITGGGGGGGGFSPLDLDPVLFLEASPTNTGAVEGGTIATWTDLSTAGNDASQATEASRPTLQLVNGVYVVRFDGTDDWLRKATDTILSQPSTVFVLGTIIGASTAPRFFDSGSISAGRKLLGRNSANMLLFASAAVQGAQSFPTNYITWTAIFDGAASSILKDGAAFASGDTGTTTTIGVTVGSNNAATPLEVLEGDIHALLVYDSALSTANREAVEAYFAPTAVTLNT